MAARRVGREQILAYRAAAHGLDRRRPLADLAEVAGRTGIQDTPPGTADVALAARLDLDGPLAAGAMADKRLVATWSVRGAPHLLPPEDLPVFTLGARPAPGTIERLWRQPEDDYATVERAMIKALGRRERSKGDVSAAVTDAVPAELARWCRSCDAHHPNESLFRGAPLFGRIVLTSTAPVLLMRAKTWLGHDASGAVAALRTDLLRRYLHAYAPSTHGRFAQWAGITTADAKDRWSAVADELVKVGSGFVLAEDLDALEQPATPGSVRLVPNKDAFLQARDRDLLLPDAAVRKQVFPVLGGPGVVLRDGDPVGSWRGAAKGKRYAVTVERFGRLSKAVRAAVATEAERVAIARGHESATLDIA